MMMSANEWNQLIPKKENWHDLFTSPDKTTFQIWCKLENIDLLSLALTNSKVMKNIFNFKPELKLMAEEINLRDLSAKPLNSNQFDVVFDCFPHVGRFKIPETFIYDDSNLLTSLARVDRKLEFLSIFVYPGYEFKKSSIAVIDVSIRTTFVMPQFHKDPILDILCSLSDVEELSFLGSCYISNPAIAQITNFENSLKTLIFINVNIGDEVFFANVILYSVFWLNSFNFIYIKRDYEGTKSVFQAQNRILADLHHSAPTLEELTLTVSIKRPYLSTIKEIHNLKLMTIFFNVHSYCSDHYPYIINQLREIVKCKPNIKIKVREYISDEGLTYEELPLLNKVIQGRNDIDSISEHNLSFGRLVSPSEIERIFNVN